MSWCLDLGLVRRPETSRGMKKEWQEHGWRRIQTELGRGLHGVRTGLELRSHIGQVGGGSLHLDHTPAGWNFVILRDEYDKVGGSLTLAAGTKRCTSVTVKTEGSSAAQVERALRIGPPAAADDAVARGTRMQVRQALDGQRFITRHGQVRGPCPRRSAGTFPPP
jgi:hypothetical protein